MRRYHFELKMDERRSLVIPQLDCAEEIYRLIDADRENFRDWLPVIDTSTKAPKDTRDNLQQRIDNFDSQKDASFYGTLDGNFIASVGFISLEKTEGEIGYWLLSQYQGKGLMTDYVRACINYGFTQRNLEKIVIKCAQSNTKSVAIAQRLGFTLGDEVGVETINGTKHQTATYVLNKADW